MRLSRLVATSLLATGVDVGTTVVPAHADTGHETIQLFIDNNNPGTTCIRIVIGIVGAPPILKIGPTCLPI